MIDQKGREIAAIYEPEPTDWSARLVEFGIIEGRRQAFEEAAKVADAWEKRAVSQLGDQRNKEAWSGEAHGAREIAAAIRSLK